MFTCRRRSCQGLCQFPESYWSRWALTVKWASHQNNANLTLWGCSGSCAMGVPTSLADSGAYMHGRPWDSPLYLCRLWPGVLCAKQVRPSATWTHRQHPQCTRTVPSLSTSSTSHIFAIFHHVSTFFTINQYHSFTLGTGNKNMNELEALTWHFAIASDVGGLTIQASLKSVDVPVIDSWSQFIESELWTALYIGCSRMVYHNHSNSNTVVSTSK